MCCSFYDFFGIFFHYQHFPFVTQSTKITKLVLIDVLTTVRQKIESMALFDSDLFKQIGKDFTDSQDEEMRKSKESLRRAFQQSISASILEVFLINDTNDEEMLPWILKKLFEV